MGLQQMVINAILNNPKIQEKVNQNEVTKNYFEVVKSGNQEEGIKLANQIMETYGLIKEDAVSQATNGLSQMFGFGGK